MSSLAEHFLRGGFPDFSEDQETTPLRERREQRRQVPRRPRITEGKRIVFAAKRVLAERKSRFTFSERKALARLVEYAERDPFNSSDSFSVDDLKKFGLDSRGESDLYRDEDDDDAQDPFGFEDRERRDRNSSDHEEMLSVAQAVTAPEATPDFDREIPEEVLASMRVLQGDEVSEKDINSLGSSSQGGNLRDEFDSRLGGGEEDDDFGEDDEEEDYDPSDAETMADDLRKSLTDEEAEDDAEKTRKVEHHAVRTARLLREHTKRGVSFSPSTLQEDSSDAHEAIAIAKRTRAQMQGKKPHTTKKLVEAQPSKAARDAENSAKRAAFMQEIGASLGGVKA